MPEISSVRPVQAGASPHPVAAVATPATPAVSSAPRQPADALSLSSGRADAWVKQAGAAPEPTGAKELQARVEKVGELLKQPGLSVDTQTSLYLLQSAAFGGLAELGIKQQANGTKAFGALTKALELSPGREDAVTAYAQTIHALSNLSFFVRPFVEGGLDISISAEAQRSIGLLKAFPDSAMATQLRQPLAKFVGDKAEAEAAKVALGRLDPESVKQAAKEMSNSAERAKKIDAE